MNKKLIIITAIAGLVSLSGTFAIGFLTKGAPASQGSDESGLNQETLIGQEAVNQLQPEAGTFSAIGTGGSKTRKAMTEKQLESLVYEIRENIREYNKKLEGLEAWEQRLEVSQDMLKKDIETLNNLRIELASMVAHLKSEREKLLNSRIEIAQAEQTNLMSIAATYDKMDASSASKILVNMCASIGQTQSKVFGDKSSNIDDAVKILYYMTERTKAKLLAELVASEPKLAAILCQRLKQIVEGK